MGSRGAHIGAICCLLKCISREMGGKRSWYGFWCYSGHCATTPTLLKTFGLFPDSGVYTVAINIRERVFAWVLCETVSSFLWMPRIVIAIVVAHLIFKGNCLSSGVSVSFCIFYQSCVMDPISPHPVKPLVLPWYLAVVLIYISLQAVDVKHIFVCLLAHLFVFFNEMLFMFSLGCNEIPKNRIDACERYHLVEYPPFLSLSLHFTPRSDSSLYWLKCLLKFFSGAIWAWGFFLKVMNLISLIDTRLSRLYISY